MVWGNGQSGTIGELLGDSLVVQVVDRFGDPVGGSEVTWTAEVGGSVTPPTSVTSPDGQAGTQRVLGADVGTYLTTAPFGVASGELGAVGPIPLELCRGGGGTCRRETPGRWHGVTTLNH